MKTATIADYDQAVAGVVETIDTMRGVIGPDAFSELLDTICSAADLMTKTFAGHPAMTAQAALVALGICYYQRSLTEREEDMAPTGPEELRRVCPSCGRVF